MNFTLDSINREREIDKDVKHQRDETFNVRYGFSVAGSIIFAIIRMIFGI